jgi:hypothetical protein
MAIDDAVAAAPGRAAYKTSVYGLAVAAVGAGLGLAVKDQPDTWMANAAAITGVVGMLIAGYAISHRPSDSVTLGLAAITAFFAGFLATNPAWDSIRLMQLVMAGVAVACALILQLGPTGRRVAFTVLVLLHFTGIMTAVTSPAPQPFLTGWLWTHFFRWHLEFSYVNNAYQFYSPQPGPAQILWFCITGEDNVPRWYKTPQKGEMLDPLGIEYYRRLSLTERGHQILPALPNEEIKLRRRQADAIPFHPLSVPEAQYHPLTEHGKHIIQGYARHVGKVLGTGRYYPDGRPVPVKSVMVYLTQHNMLTQLDYQNKRDPYGPDTYLPFFVGRFDGEGRSALTPLDRGLLYWLEPILKVPDGDVKDYVIVHAESDPFDVNLEWRQEPKPAEGGR